jgi:hypothetical protein
MVLFITTLAAVLIALHFGAAMRMLGVLVIIAAICLLV